MKRIATIALRWRYLILAVWGTGWNWWSYRWNWRHLNLDYYLFVYGGRVLYGRQPSYHGNPLQLYDKSEGVIQVGPPPLLLLGLTERLPHDLAVWAALIACLGLASVWLVERTMIGANFEPTRVGLGTLFGGAVALASWSSLEHLTHLEDAVAITGILGALAAMSSRRHWLIPALTLGFAMACKPWATIALPILFHLPRRTALRASVVAIIFAALWWIPFVVAAPGTIHALGTLPSVIMRHSVFNLFLDRNTGAPSFARTFGIALGACLGGLAVARGKWLGAPVVAVAGRMLLEPRWFAYYGVGPVMTALIWDMAQERRIPLWAASASAVEFLVQPSLPPRVGSAAHLVLWVALIASVLLSRRQFAGWQATRTEAHMTASPQNLHA